MQEIKNISAYRRALKHRILDLALDLFGRHGIKAVKMDDIAKGLNISKRTLYEIYDNKELLLFEAIKSYMEQKDQNMQRFADDHHNVMDIIIHVYIVKVDEFRRTNPCFFSDIEKYPAVLEYLGRCQEKNRQLLVDFLQRGISEGYFRPDIHQDIIVMLFEELGNVVMNRQLYLRYPIEDIFRNLLFTSLRGLCTKKGIDIIDQFLSEQGQ